VIRLRVCKPPKITEHVSLDALDEYIEDGECTFIIDPTINWGPTAAQVAGMSRTWVSIRVHYTTLVAHIIPRLLETFYHEPGIQGDRKGRPYHTTNRPAKPYYGIGSARPRPADETGFLLREELCGM
jgi:hypothetical protein